MGSTSQLPPFALAERTNMLTYIEVLRDAENGGRDAYHLNTTERSLLRNLAADHYDRPATWAQNILCFHYAHCRTPQTGGEDNSHRPLPYTPRKAGSSKAEPTLTAIPNPGVYFMTFSVDLLGNPDAALLVIRDIVGRELQKLPIRQTRSQVIWDASQALPGSYTATLLNGGKQIKSVKFTLRP